MITQRDVAKKAGVSFITVSRVLNNSGYVKKETREKILKTIKELNYYTNHVGQALRKKKVKTLGIIIPEPPDVPVHGMDYYNLILQGIDRSSFKHGYDMLLSSYKQNDPKVDYFRLFFHRKVDGLILFIPDMRYLKIKKVVSNAIPCVIIGERPSSCRIDFVDAQNFEGTFRAAEYLISRGLSKIAFIKGKPRMQCSIDRLNGFLKAAEKHGLDVPDSFIIQGDFTSQSGKNAVRKLIASGNLPDAILCSNDLMAIGALTEAKKSGIRIPKDISIIGFDDIHISEYTDPSLSTIRQPLFDMGFAASEMLFSRIRNPQRKPECKIFSVELVIRKSII